MTRYIDADYFLKEYCEPYPEVYKAMSAAIRHMPTVDAEPVRYGKWTADESTYTDGEAQCSVCKTTFYVDDLYCVGEKAQSELPNYCPHCGACMRGDE